MVINKQDTNGSKALLPAGELGFDNYQAGGDKGRVYVGRGDINVPLANKAEVDAAVIAVGTHVARIDNPHAVTKAQVGLGNVDNTSDSSKNVLSANKLTTARTINGVAFDGTGNITVVDDTAVKLTGNETIAGTKTFSSNIQGSISGNAGTITNQGALATLSTIGAAQITDNSVGAAELNVVGNGTTVQYLRSNGDGTFTWATPTNTFTTINNTLTSTSTTEALSANQGKVLNDTKQATLVSGTSIKTINSQSLLGSGNIVLTATSDFASITDKPTTIAGYDITDAYTKTEINSSLALKVDKVAGKGLSTEDYTSIEKSKLAGIAASANNYSLPVATGTVLGGVKAGANISIDANGVISASGGAGGAAATETSAGIIELATTAEAQAGTDNLRAITPLRLRDSLNASGTAPIYACRAWATYNTNSSTYLIEGGNISSLSDIGTGITDINFINSMPNSNYSVFVGTETGTALPCRSSGGGGTYYPSTKSSVRVVIANNTPAGVDSPFVSVAII